MLFVSFISSQAHDLNEGHDLEYPWRGIMNMGFQISNINVKMWNQKTFNQFIMGIMGGFCVCNEYLS